MKVFVYLCLVLSLCGCTNVINKSEEVVENIKENIWTSDSLPTQDIILNTTASAGILNEISTNLKRGYVKEYNDTLEDKYDVYLGDYLSVPLNLGEDSYNLLYYPLGTSYELEIKDGRLLFRSIYQGEYEVSIYSAGSFSRKIKINNKLKYQFTEQNNYDVILQSYQSNNLKALEEAAAMHRIAFPNSFRDKEISFMLIELAGKDGNAKLIKDEVDFLQKNTKLADYDKIVILNSLKKIQGSDFEITSALLEYDKQSPELNNEIVNLIVSKTTQSQNEIVFLEKYYSTLPTPDENLKNLIGNWYLKNGNILKGTQYLNQSENPLNIEQQIIPTSQVTVENGSVENLEAQNYTQYLTFIKEGKNNFEKENYIEAIIYFEKALELNKDYIEQKDIYFYMGQSHFKTGNYSESVKDFKNSLNLEKNDEKKAEIYYNIGISYDKLGDKEQAVNYLTYVRQNYKNSPWSVKSSLYMLQQMQQYSNAQ